MKIKLKKRTPEETQAYLMTQIAGLIADRRDLLNASKRVLEWLVDYGALRGNDPEIYAGELRRCIQRIEGK